MATATDPAAVPAGAARPPAAADPGPLRVAFAGVVAYERAWAWQRLLVDARRTGLIGDVVLGCEHDRVDTAGRRADMHADVLGGTGIRVVRVDRGGQVTYHGPGQLVVYPIVRLPRPRAVRAYVAALQDAAVRTAASFGVPARADDRRVGVWVGDAKLVAIGVRVSDRVTCHGLAFNVHPDLADFAGIVACGDPAGRACSLASLGVDATVAEVGRRLVGHLAELLGRAALTVPAGALGVPGVGEPTGSYTGPAATRKARR